MMPPVKGHLAAAILMLAAHGGLAATGAAEAAREAARKVAGFAGRDEVVLTFRNTSSARGAELDQVRAIFQAELRGGAAGPVEVRVTLAENLAEYLVIAEARRGEERRVFLSGWRRGPAVSANVPISIDKRLLWDQNDPILDVIVSGDTMLVLSPDRVVRCARRGGRWEAEQTIPLAGVPAPPRDPRGRLVARAGGWEAYLPGAVCRGGECRAGDEAWPLEAGLEAHLARGRNYFDGRIAVGGAAYTVAPFFSAARVGDVWLLAGLDGRTRLFGRAFEPLGAAGAWGSDVAGAGNYVLATRPGEAADSDAVDVYEIVNREARAAGAAIFPGPVTALWAAGDGAAVAVARDAATGRYYAFVLAITGGA
jgi:hypothetical protein